MSINLIHFSLQQRTFAGPKAYYFKFTVPNGAGRKHTQDAFKAEWSAMDPEPGQNAGFTITMQREFATATKELTRTTAATFLYGCGCIPPHRVLAVVKALGTSIVWKHCIMQDREEDWFRFLPNRNRLSRVPANQR